MILKFSVYFDMESYFAQIWCEKKVTCFYTLADRHRGMFPVEVIVSYGKSREFIEVLQIKADDSVVCGCIEGDVSVYQELLDAVMDFMTGLVWIGELEDTFYGAVGIVVGREGVRVPDGAVLVAEDSSIKSIGAGTVIYTCGDNVSVPETMDKRRVKELWQGVVDIDLLWSIAQEYGGFTALAYQ